MDIILHRRISLSRNGEYTWWSFVSPHLRVTSFQITGEFDIQSVDFSVFIFVIISDRIRLGLQLLRSSAPRMWASEELSYSEIREIRYRIYENDTHDTFRFSTLEYVDIHTWMTVWVQVHSQRSLWYSLRYDWRHWRRRLWRRIDYCSVHLIVCHVTSFTISSSFMSISISSMIRTLSAFIAVSQMRLVIQSVLMFIIISWLRPM